MAIPKALRVKLTGLLKEGATLPDELEDGVFFESEDALAAAIAQRSKSKISEAEKKGREQAEAQMADMLKQIGVDDPEKIGEFIQRHNEANGKVSELEQVTVKYAKLEREHNKLKTESAAEIADLKGFKVKVTKTEALTPHLVKVHPDLRGMVSENILAKLTITDKGEVKAPEDKAIDAYVDDLIKATPSLKAPDFKAGAGTGPSGGKSSGTGAGDSNGKQQNGASTDDFPKDLAGGLAAILREKAAPPPGRGNV